MKTKWSILALAALASVGCNETHRARVHEAHGLGEGAAVTTSGVPIGHVDTLHVVEGEVEIEFTVEGDHEITLRRDSCVRVAREGGAAPTLELRPGVGEPLTEEQPIPECEPPTLHMGELMDEIGAGMGQLLDRLGQGLMGGLGATPSGNPPAGNPSGANQTGSPSGGNQPVGNAGGNPPGGNLAPPFPFPLGPRPPTQTPPVCTQLSVSVDGTETLERSFFLPDGGRRVTLTFHNGGTESATISGVNSAVFVSRERHMMTPGSSDPGATSAWFMPFAVSGGAHATVTVSFDGTSPDPLDEIEVRGVSRTGEPFAGCTLHATELSPR